MTTIILCSPYVIPYLCVKSILELAVDGPKLLGKQPLCLIEEATADGALARHLVTTLGDDITVVLRATTVPGEELIASVSVRVTEARRELTLGVSSGMSVRISRVAVLIRSSFSFSRVISGMLKLESLEGWRESKYASRPAI